MGITTGKVEVKKVLSNRDELVRYYESLEGVLQNFPNDEIHGAIKAKWISGKIHVDKLKSDKLTCREISKALDCMQGVLSHIHGIAKLLDAVTV